MERGMMLGIRSRAEGIIPPAFEQALEIGLWLAAFGCGLAAGIRFIRQPAHFHPLGVALEGIVFLFIFTFIQPDLWLRIVLDLVLPASVVIAYTASSAEPKEKTDDAQIQAG